MAINEEIAKAFGAHGLWKTRIQQAIETCECEHSPEDVSRDDKCAFGRWLFGPELPASIRGSGDYKTVVRLHADFHRVAGSALRKALAGDRTAAQEDLKGPFSKAADALRKALVNWQREAATSCSGYRSSWWRRICFFWAGRVWIRIWATIAIPSAVVLGTVVYVDLQQADTISETKQLQRVVELIADTSGVVHELQRERGLSAALAVKPDASLAARIRDQISQTQARRKEAEAAITQVAADVPPALAGRLQAAAGAFAGIDALRPRIADGKVTFVEVLETYGTAIDALLAATEEAAGLASSPEVLNPLGSLAHLSHAKEYAGRERATGAAALNAGMLGEQSRRRLIELAALQQERLATFAAGITAAQRADYHAAVQPVSGPHERLRDFLLEGDVESVKPEAWFTAASDRIDRLRQTEERLIADIVATTQAIRASTWREVILFNGLVLAFSALGSLVVLYLARGITKPVYRLTTAMRTLAGGENGIEVPALEMPDEIGEMARAVLVFQQQAQTVEQMTAEREQQRIKADGERRRSLMVMADNIEGQTSAVVAHVAAETLRILENAERMAAGAQNVEQNAQVVASAADQSLATAQAVAGAAEQLSASIREIAAQVARSKEVVAQAVAASEQATGTVDDLRNAMLAIDQVVGVIVAIASQTNLLALNATIEAARAGDVGKGFAVVASEVKNLANQTAREAEDISRRLATIKAMTEKVTEVIGGTRDSIERVEEIAGSIAAAVEEQDAATKEIARNVQHSAAAAQEVADRIGEVAGDASATGRQAVEMERMTDAMAARVTELGQVLTQVVRTTAPEVDRRDSPRLPVKRRAKVVCSHGEYEGEVSDMSLGGACITGVPKARPGETGSFVIDGLVIPFTAVANEQGLLRLRLDQSSRSNVQDWLKQHAA